MQIIKVASKESRKKSSMRERERERADSFPVLSLGGLKA